MQPYLFPYLGYFQLINAVDVFVISDDVQYINRGWINRNQILVQHKPMMFTFPVKKDSYSKYINDRYYNSEYFGPVKEKFLASLYYTYKNTTHFKDVFELVQNILDYPDLNVSEFNRNSIRALCDYLGIDTGFVVSSHLEKNTDLKAQDAVIETNRVLGSDCYINPVGGRTLYSKDAFREHGIELQFIEMDPIEYDQLGRKFVPSLSIIDVMMFNSKERIGELLQRYSLS